MSENRRQRPKTAALTLLGLAALVVSACGASQRPAAKAPGVAGGIQAVIRVCDPGEGSSLARARECYQRRLLAVVSAAGAPAAELPKVDAAAARDGGFLFDNCHVLMHWVDATTHSTTTSPSGRFSATCRAPTTRAARRDSRTA